jgi:hypothetical protein
MKQSNKQVFLLALFFTTSILSYPQNNMEKNLKPIRENFTKINTKKDWTKIDSLSLIDGDSNTILFYSKKGLEKLIHTNFGESGKIIIEYYLLNGKLSFVLEQLHHYNMPYVVDSIVKVDNPTIEEIYDPKKTKIEEDRSYFINEKLIHQINNEDCGSPFAKSYLITEEKRLKTEYKRILKLAKKNKL